MVNAFICGDRFLPVITSMLIFIGAVFSAHAVSSEFIGSDLREEFNGATVLIRDPTSPIKANGKASVALNQQEDKSESLKLHGIYKKGSKFIALINGISVQEGDAIMGKVITKIEHNKVTFTGDESGVISLYPTVISKR